MFIGGRISSTMRVASLRKAFPAGPFCMATGSPESPPLEMDGSSGIDPSRGALISSARRWPPPSPKRGQD